MGSSLAQLRLWDIFPTSDLAQRRCRGDGSLCVEMGFLHIPRLCVPRCPPVPPKEGLALNASAAGCAPVPGSVPLVLALPGAPGCDATTPVMHQDRGDPPLAPSSAPYPTTLRAGGFPGSCHPRQPPGHLGGCAQPASPRPPTAVARLLEERRWENSKTQKDRNKTKGKMKEIKDNPKDEGERKGRERQDEGER